MPCPTELQKWRKSKALTQQEMADAIGIHVQYLSDIERGARRPGMRVATKIRDYTEGFITLDQLASGGASDREAA